MTKKKRHLLYFLMFFFSIPSYASPKITVSYEVDQHMFTRVKVKNETRRVLGCYVAIDGHKRKFKLTSLATSKWYKATDTRFNYTDFSVFCDYIEYFK